jgi:hypothetical protein
MRDAKTSEGNVFLNAALLGRGRYEMTFKPQPPLNEAEVREGELI